MKDHGMVEDICELAERNGERLPAPSWHHGKYPDLDGLNRDGDPERDFEQDFPTGYRGCYVVLSCKDVHTAHGVVRSPTVMHVDCPRNGSTPEQARALGAALIAAADTAETI